MYNKQYVYACTTNMNGGLHAHTLYIHMYSDIYINVYNIYI